MVLSTIPQDHHQGWEQQPYTFTYQDADGANGSVTISSTSHLHSGTTVPENTLGVDQDWYLDTTDGSGKFYQRVAGVWGLILTIATGGGTDNHFGTADPDADTGGVDGDWYLNTTNGQWWELVTATWTSRYTPTAVTANPTGTDGDDITRIGIGATNYNLSVPPGVTANPAGDDGDDLNRLAIGDTNYNIAGSGGDGVAVDAAVTAYAAPLSNVAAAAYAAATQILTLGTATVNEGSFTTEVNSVDSKDRIIIPGDGFYELTLSVHVVSGDRTIASCVFTRERAGVTTSLPGFGTGYARGFNTELFAVVEHSIVAELEADDKIGVTMISSASVNLALTGASSAIEIVKVTGGPKGDKGDAGADGVAGNAGDVATEAVAGVVRGATACSVRSE